MPRSIYHVCALSALFILITGCSRLQEPTALSSLTGSGDSTNSIGEDLIPSERSEDWSDSTLDERDWSESIEDGKYNGREMVAGALEPVYYGFDSSAIAAAERIKLQSAAEYLLENSNTGLLIEGHCDWYGTAEYNLALGDRRAKSARDYLITLGVEPERMEILSKGSLDAATGLSKIDATIDRRSDLIVLK